MAQDSTIQDYSMIDAFLSRSVNNYNKQLFGDYDDKTGYFEEAQPEENVIEESQPQDDSNNVVNNDDAQSEEDMYNSVFANENEFNGFGPGPSFGGGRGPVPGTGKEETPLSKQISNKESQGKYTATNPNSSATGKYQFLWSQWGDSIKKVTGVSTQKDFLTNPAAQEKYYAYYEKTYLLPEVKKIKNEIKTNLTDSQLAKLVHFRGEGGARKYLKGQVSDKPESYNMPTSQYIKQAGGSIPNVGYPGMIEGDDETAQYSLEHAKNLKVQKNGHFKGLIPMDAWTDDMMNYVDKIKFVTRKGEKFVKVRGALPKPTGQPVQPTTDQVPPSYLQSGGNVARTKQQQYIGLNDESMDSLILPLQGENTIRGLDSGQPVMVEDEFGTSEVLYGPKHKIKTKGKVYEKRLKY
jgi:hypothetical protein